MVKSGFCNLKELELRLGELEESRTKESLQRETAAAEGAVARPARRPLPEHLPHEVQTYLPKEEACPDCGGKLQRPGEDASEILAYVREIVPRWRNGLVEPALQPLVETLRRHVMNSDKLHGDDRQQRSQYRLAALAA